MLTIILGILASLLLTFLVAFLGALFENEDVLHPAAVIFVGGVIASILAGIFGPISDYGKMELEKRIPLVALNNSTEVTSDAGLIYVSHSSDGVYTYSYEVDSYSTISSGPKSFMLDTIVIVSTDPKCEVPELLVYKQKAKLSIWTFGLSWKTKYIFHIPPDAIDNTGTVIEDTN